MGKVELKALPHEGGQIALEMHLDGEPLAHMILEAPELSSVIEGMANVRMGMSEEVVRELDPGSRINFIGDPIWRAWPAEGGTMLALRHPGLGWLSFLFPPHEAEAIARCLQENAAPRKA